MCLASKMKQSANGRSYCVYTLISPTWLILVSCQGSELQYEVEVAGPPLCMRLWGEGSGEGREGDQVLYGTQTGRVGLVQLTAEEPNYCWDMLNDRKSVSCLLLNGIIATEPHSLCCVQVWRGRLSVNL